MAAEQRKLLEQLMGDNLMSMPGTTSRQAQTKLTDSNVCRPYICGSCPYDLFTNTKQDFGNCPKTHLPNLKEEYQALPKEEKEKLGFDFDYYREISRHIQDCDNKIDKAQKRLEKTPEEIRQTNVLLGQIADLNKTIEAGIVEVEILAEEGAVNLAVQDFHKVRLAKMQKDEKERDLKSLSDTSGPSGHQKLQVCDVCGAYLSRLDNDRRLADHFFGKMHLGYAQMRKEMQRLQVELKGRQPPPRQSDGYDGGRDNGFGDPYNSGPRSWGAGGGGGGGGGGYGRRGGYGGGGGGGRGGGRW